MKPKQRWIIAGIFVICAAPIVAAIAAYFWWTPEARNNYGQLVQPQRPVPGLEITDFNGQHFDIKQLRGKWWMLSVDSGVCAQRCAEKLYAMRQVWAATGEKQRRVERVWVVNDDAAVPEKIIQAHSGLRILKTSSQHLPTWLLSDATRTMEDAIYLIDPLGNLMLYWPAKPDLKKMRKDLGRLLWVSRVG